MKIPLKPLKIRVFHSGHPAEGLLSAGLLSARLLFAGLLSAGLWSAGLLSAGLLSQGRLNWTSQGRPEEVLGTSKLVGPSLRPNWTSRGRPNWSVHLDYERTYYGHPHWTSPGPPQDIEVGRPYYIPKCPQKANNLLITLCEYESVLNCMK